MHLVMVVMCNIQYYYHKALGQGLCFFEYRDRQWGLNLRQSWLDEWSRTQLPVTVECASKRTQPCISSNECPLCSSDFQRPLRLREWQPPRDNKPIPHRVSTRAKVNRSKPRGVRQVQRVASGRFQDTEDGHGLLYKRARASTTQFQMSTSNSQHH